MENHAKFWSWENWQKPVKGENYYQNRLSWISTCSARLREENTFHIIPFQIQTHWLLTLYLPGTAVTFLSVLFSVLRAWLGNCQVGDPKHGWAEMGIELHLWLGSIGSPQGNCLSPSSFWLSLGVALDLGRVVPFVPSLGTPLVSMGLLSTARNIYCLS